MTKIMKFDGSIIEKDVLTYEWVIGETEYNLVYDNNGDLLGIDIEGFDKDILDDIVKNPWDYNFPCDLDEYFE
ncbi:MAG: hypothetical protein ACLR4X_05340 [Clostridia bacterium]